MQEQWGNIKKFNIYIIGILEREEREKGAEETLEVTNILV